MFNKIKKIVDKFIKKNKMNFTEKSLPEIEEELKNFDFQWIKGENLGGIEKFDSVSTDGKLKFVNFKGGGRMNLEIMSEFMDVFPSTPVIFDQNSNIKSNSQKIQEKGKVNSVKYGENKIGIEDSAIHKLLKKQKPNWVNVNINIKLNLPTKSLYNILISSFEDAESEIVDYVTEGIEIEDIKEAISESIKTSFYNQDPNKKRKILEVNNIEDNEISKD